MISQPNNPPQIERSAIYSLPKFLSQIEHITTVDTGGLQFVICCDKLKLYIFPLVPGASKPLGNIHQSLPIPNIKSLKTIAKNYLLIETQNKYIGIFQIIKSILKQSSTQKSTNTIQASAVKVQFSEVLKWRIFSCHFIREVMENLFQVQVFFSDLEFQIFQFTNKNKRGSMSFTISPNGKMQKYNKKQLYGSKCFFNIGRKLMYWLKNFSDKHFVIQQLTNQQSLGGHKLLAEPFGYFGVQRSEEYKYIYANLIIKDCMNPAKRYPLKLEKQSFLNELKTQISQLSGTKRKPINQQNPFNELVEQSSYLDNLIQILQSYKISIFSDLLMVENKSKKELQIYQIKADSAELTGKQNSRIASFNQSKQKKKYQQSSEGMLQDLRRWEWFFGNSKKLIAIDRLGSQLKYIQEISLENQKQNLLTVEVVDLESKLQKIQQNIIKNSQKRQESQKNTVNQVLNNKKQEILQVKTGNARKFSKDELQKFCSQFKDQDVDKYVSGQLKKKVEEIKNWVKVQIPKVQKDCQVVSKKSPNESIPNLDNTEPIIQLTKQEVKQSQVHQRKIKVNQQNQQQTPKVENIEVKNQEISLNLKQKPPIKIIQRNKISVAKTSQQLNDKKSTQEPENDETIKQTLRKKKVSHEQANTQKTIQNDQSNTIQAQTENLFKKYGSKQQEKQAITNDKQKKRFIKNFLSQDRKEEPHQSDKKQTIQSQNIQKTHENQKKEKMKFNVITRASLLKKKQAEVIPEKQSPKTQIKQQKNEAQNVLQSNKGQQPSIASQEKAQINQTDRRNQSNKQSCSKEQINEDIQCQPKTKYIPWIDITKVSKNHLNDCEFLSEDSISSGQKIQQGNQDLNQPNQKQQSIEEQIDADSVGQQNDMGCLIDENLVQSQNNTQISTTQLKEKQKLIQIISEQEIQKFCYTLLDEQQVPKYHKKDSISPQTKDKGQAHNKKIQILPLSYNKPSNLILNQTEPQILYQKKKQQQDEISKFNSLLFKTNIKRTNIFASQTQQNQPIKIDKPSLSNFHSQGQQKNEQNLTVQKSSSIKEIIDNQNDQRQAIAGQLQEKTQSEQNQKQKTIQLQLNIPYNQENQPSLKQAEKQKQDHSVHQQNTRPTQNLNQKTNDSEQPSQKNQVQPIRNSEQIFKTKEPIQSLVLQQSQKIQDQKLCQKNCFQGKNQARKNPFLEANKITSSIFPNPPSDWLLNKASQNMAQKKDSNAFSIFNKNTQVTSNPFINPPSIVGGGSNANMFKKFLHQRQIKSTASKQQQMKQIPPCIDKICANQTQVPFDESQISGRRSGISQDIKSTRLQKFQQNQKLTIPTSALPEIQELISKYQKSTISLLEQQQKTIIKSLQQIPHTHNPYNKNNSLLLPEQIKQEIIKQSKLSVKKWLGSKMIDKIQLSFRQIMQQHKQIYEEALKYYENEARSKITTMQLQYEQQSTILMDIQNVSANMSAALQFSIVQGEELHTYQIKEWNKQIQQTQTKIVDPLASKIQESQTYFASRNQSLQKMTGELTEIKEILKEKLSKKKELKQKKRTQKQLKTKQKIQEEANRQIKIKEESKKRSKKHKMVEQAQLHVSFDNYLPQKNHEGHNYGRQPYPYY